VIKLQWDPRLRSATAPCVTLDTKSYARYQAAGCINMHLMNRMEEERWTMFVRMNFQNFLDTLDTFEDLDFPPSHTAMMCPLFCHPCEATRVSWLDEGKYWDIVHKHDLCTAYGEPALAYAPWDSLIQLRRGRGGATRQKWRASRHGTKQIEK